MILVAMEAILAGNVTFLSYLNVCITKWAADAASLQLGRVLNHISLERAGHQQGDKLCGSVGVVYLV